MKNKETVVFCASIFHAEEIAELFKETGVKAEAISGRTKPKERDKILKNYENGDISVLCACDLLNEGWDLINAANKKEKFMDMIRTMTMSYSYKPVLLKAMLHECDEKGRVLIEDIIDYFIDFYMVHK